MNFTHINFHNDWNLESCIQNTINQKKFNQETGGSKCNLHHIYILLEQMILIMIMKDGQSCDDLGRQTDKKMFFGKHTHQIFCYSLRDI